MSTYNSRLVTATLAGHAATGAMSDAQALSSLTAERSSTQRHLQAVTATGKDVSKDISELRSPAVDDAALVTNFLLQRLPRKQLGQIAGSAALAGAALGAGATLWGKERHRRRLKSMRHRLQALIQHLKVTASEAQQASGSSETSAAQQAVETSAAQLQEHTENAKKAVEQASKAWAKGRANAKKAVEEASQARSEELQQDIRKTDEVIHEATGLLSWLATAPMRLYSACRRKPGVHNSDNESDASNGDSSPVWCVQQ